MLSFGYFEVEIIFLRILTPLPKEVDNDALERAGRNTELQMLQKELLESRDVFTLTHFSVMMLISARTTTKCEKPQAVDVTHNNVFPYPLFCPFQIF